MRNDRGGKLGILGIDPGGNDGKGNLKSGKLEKLIQEGHRGNDYDGGGGGGDGNTNVCDDGGGDGNTNVCDDGGGDGNMTEVEMMMVMETEMIYPVATWLSLRQSAFDC
ncbi:unnamed protein product [Microthlaspi erraticum]|uniref:Uncharacterized protein n=1 Tax=Microthlaspi erraticum TaxID=1685480 RepID=A0A6D2JWZ1_9BRAS|nr:unnamed protein product [Microthlaspi erraticum]